FLAIDVAMDPRGAPLAFIAPIYGGETQGRPVPPDAPPLFAVVAQDDRTLFRVVEGSLCRLVQRRSPGRAAYPSPAAATALASASAGCPWTAGPIC
ncbi:MAG: hypothetical protein QOJ42_2364, partial [Acidobacteriaceae bacterium]|nr:hypothetical protein [Acidobacteriaceae bacterium]